MLDWRISVHAGNLNIMIVLSLFDQKVNRDNQCEHFRCHDGKPDAVKSQQQREKQHCRDLEQKRPQERDRSGDHTVSKRCEERRAKDVVPHKQKRQGVERQRPTGQRRQISIVADKNLCERLCRQDSQNCQNDIPQRDQAEAFTKQPF